MTLKKIIVSLFLALLHSVPGYAQVQEGSLFKSGEKINFIGNSITHGGEYHLHVLLYYATRFPNQKVTFYNSGISGDNANDIFRRLDSEIIPKQADWSVLMAGMNDVNRALYAPSRQWEEGLVQKKQEAISNYRNHLDKVLQKLSQTGTKIILQQPTIYDQTARLATDNHAGVNDALQQCTKIVEELAKKYNAQVVDYFGFMNETNQRLQQRDPASTIISIDRIHPWATGDLIMAYQFLKETNAPQTVAAVTIEKGAVKESTNCTISALKTGKGTVSFELKAESLPFPLADEPQTNLALSLIPFNEQLNREMLKVSKLKKGRYSLSIDETFIATFNHNELAEGVNLTSYRHSPQYQQALKVKDIAASYRTVQHQLRDIKWVQYRHLPAELWDAETATVEEFITNRLNFLNTNDGRKYAEAQKYFTNYLVLKPQEKAMEAKLVELRDSMYALSQPIPHRYELKALPAMTDKGTMFFGLNQAGADFGKNKPGVFGVDYTYPTSKQLDYMKSKNFSLIRLPFKWDRIQHSLNADLDQVELARLKSVVDGARVRNQWVLLDLHNYCRRNVNGKYLLIGSPELPTGALADLWGRLANEFKDYDNIWGYGLMNEPYDMLPATPWFSIAQASINEIRETDKTTPIVVGGDHWSSAAKWLQYSDNLKNLKDPSRNLIFEAHLYFDADGSGTYPKSYEEEGGSPDRGVERARPFVEWLQQNKFRGFIGEYGIPDKDERWLVTLDNLLQYLQQNGVGGTYWAAGPWWGKHFMAVEPREGKDQPQMKVLEKYTIAKPTKK
ncbi:cellulase family glycosylhydrolase [Pontibacter sp. 13R65]|uniref:cellulase family glycosylhydrolase n=1 Tax=Pontibacter sp. 13R65 TaxID=3127458 RepID=UPI00301D307E